MGGSDMPPSFLFFALNVRGAPVGPQITILEKILIEESLQLFRAGGKKRNFKSGLFQVQITTKYLHVTLGHLSGTMSSATVESELGNTTIDYAIDANLLKWRNEKEREELQRRYGDLFQEMSF